MSTSSIVEKSLPNFELSEPVFVLDLDDDDKTHIRIRQDPNFIAKKPDETDDPIRNLAIFYFRERFDGKKYTYDKSSLISQVVGQCARKVIEFFERESNAKKPRQTVMFDWLNSKPNGINSDLNDDIVLLCKYITEFKGENHARNAMGILNLIKEKYDT